MHTYTKFSLRLLAILVMLLIGMQSAQPVLASPVHSNGPATTWYVATTGDDGNNCLAPATPCQTIQQALELALNGDVIWVAEGTYINPGSDQVVLINKNVGIQGGWNGTFDTQTGFSTIDGQNLQAGIKLGDDGNQGVTTDIARFIVKNSNGGIWSSSAYYYTSDHLVLHESAVINNSGYGIYIDGALDLANVTISGNSGGGILHQSTQFSDIININNSTIAGNTGPGLYTQYQINMKNSILSGNTDNGNPSNCYLPFNGLLLSGGYNLVDNTTGCKLTARTGDQFNVDPHLSALLPQLGYIPISSDSPAVDAGNNDTCAGVADQRGVPRYDGNGDSIITCDVGAFEYVTPGPAAQLVMLNGNDQHVIPNTAFPTPFSVIALDDDGNPVNNVDITFTAPSSGPSGVFANTDTNTSGPIPTDAGGVATSPEYIANDVLGSYEITASSMAGNIVFDAENILWFVTPDGDDANDCKGISTPCASINAALSKSYPGNRILISQGIYFEDALWLPKNITLSGGWDAGTFTTQNGFSTIDGQDDHSLIFINEGLSMEMENMILQNGNATGPDNSWGGGIYNRGTLLLRNSIVRNNRAIVGGGILNVGSLTIVNSSIINNSASGSGGGIASSNSLISVVTILNSTIGNNSALAAGGGIFVDTGAVTLNFSTISNNQANTGGGIAQQSSGTANIQNTILAVNTATESGADCSGEIASDGHNIIQDTAGCSIPLAVSDKEADPQLGVFVPNQVGYFPLKAASPARDAADDSCSGLVDARGLSRPWGNACDIGSYEYIFGSGLPTTILAIDGSGQFSLPNHTFPKLLKAIVLDDLGSPIEDVQVTFTAPASGASGIFTDTQNTATTSLTDAGGVATSSLFTANGEFGEFVVSATVAGVSSVADFELHNEGWFVSPAGNDQNDCQTPATACATINAAIDKVPSGVGVGVFVAEGTYTGSVSDYIVTISKYVVLSGGWDVNFTLQEGLSIIDGEGTRSGILVNEPTGKPIVIERFSIQHCASEGGIQIDAQSSLTINNSIITENAATQNVGSGIRNLGDLTLNESIVSHNISLYSGNGNIWNTGTIVINFSQIHDNVGTGIYNYDNMLRLWCIKGLTKSGVSM